MPSSGNVRKKRSQFTKRKKKHRTVDAKLFTLLITLAARQNAKSLTLLARNEKEEEATASTTPWTTAQTAAQMTDLHVRLTV